MRLLWLSIIVGVFALSTDAEKARRSASESLRAFGSMSKQTKARMEKTERDQLQILSRIANPELIERLQELELLKRQDEDPFCDLDVDCSNTSKRMFVDGFTKEYRTSNGQCNNVGRDNWSWGVAGIQQLRLLENAYENGKWNPRANSVTGTKKDPVELPTPRNVSNTVHSTDSDKADNDQDVSLALFFFMQFIDHDVIKTPDGNIPRNRVCCDDNTGFCMAINTTADDADSYFSEGDCMNALRSFTVFDCNDDSGFQNQINDITSYLDASMVYGSSDDEMDAVRSKVGGFLETSTFEFMPEADDTDDLMCDNVAEPAFCPLAGDTRAAVHPGLSMFHTVFLREHNRIANYLGIEHRDWSDDQIFYETRKIIAAIIQHITLDEMLPLVLDSSVLSKWGLSSAYSYNSSQDASIIQIFSLAYRYHNMMPASLHRAELVNVAVTNTDSTKTEEVLENPGYLFEKNYYGLSHIALGQVLNGCPMSTGTMNDASRNFLFKDDTDPDAISFDLATLNIQRGREWGTPPYHEYRELCGIGAATDWTDLYNTHSNDTIDLLKISYKDVQDVDAWTGMVTEEKLGTSISGATQSCLVGMQFAYIRDGDRFWYETDDEDVSFTADQLTQIKKVKLARVMCDNLEVSMMRKAVFKTDSDWVSCSSTSDIPEMDLSVW